MRGGWSHDGEGQAFEWRLLRRLWPFVRPHSRLLACGVGLMTLSSLAKLAGPYIIKVAIDGPMSRGDPAGLALLALLFLGAEALQGALDAAQALLVRTSGQEVLRDLRAALFDKSLRLPVSYLDTTPGGRILSRITADVAVLSDLFSSGIAALLGDLLLLLGILVVLLQLDPFLALVSYTTLPLLLVVSEGFRRRMRSVYRVTREKTAILTGQLQAHIRGAEILRLSGAENWAETEFAAANADHRDAFLRSVTLYALFFPVVELVSAATLALVLWQGGGAVIQERVSFGALVAFIEYLQKFFRPVRDLSEKYSVVQASMAAIERISEFLDLPEEPPGGTEQRSLAGGIALDGVEFAYHRSVPVIRGVDLDIPSGQVVALVGPTGCGKTTLAHLLLGFYAPDQGRIRIDGVDLGTFDRGHLRRQIALVPQDVFLFEGSVMENIRLGREWVTPGEAVAAARAVGLHESVVRLPAGYDTAVLEEGALLSAGQRQLVSFARALAGQPKLLVLDEATSEVDQATEALIEAALQTLFRGRTSLVIAHRLATVRRADRVVVLRHGRIVEEGTHQELLAAGGVYRTLYELQFRGGTTQPGLSPGQPALDRA